MAGYGTLTGVTVEEFGAQVRQRRGVRRMSRRDLAQRSGVSYGALDKLESPSPPRPRRSTAIDLATAVHWDVDEALALLDYEPLSDDERAALAGINSPREQLDRLLDELPPSQVYGLLVLVRSMVNPQALPQADDDPGSTAAARPVHVQDVREGSGDYLGDRMREERERRTDGADT